MMMDLAREDRAVTGLVDAAELLHDRGRQSDLVAGDRASAARLLDLLKGTLYHISLIEAPRVKLCGQYLGRPPAAEQFDDAFGLLPRIESRHSASLYDWRNSLP